MEFRQQVADNEAFVFVTSEHNRRISAAQKNALNTASRPWGQSILGGNPALVAFQSVADH